MTELDCTDWQKRNGLNQATKRCWETESVYFIPSTIVFIIIPHLALKCLNESLNGNQGQNNTKAQLQAQNSQLRKKINEGKATQGELERRLKELQTGTKNHEAGEKRDKATKPANRGAGATKGSGGGRNDETCGGTKGRTRT